MMKLYSAIFFLLATVAAPATAQDVSVLKSHDTKQPLEIAADHFELQQKEGRAILRQNVKVVQGGMTLTSEGMTIFYSAEQGSDLPTIARLDATGGVSLVSASETITADWGIYDVEERLITLGGSVNLVRGATEIAGARLEFDLRSGVMRLDSGQQDGRVRGTFKVPD